MKDIRLRGQLTWDLLESHWEGALLLPLLGLLSKERGGVIPEGELEQKLKHLPPDLVSRGVRALTEVGLLSFGEGQVRSTRGSVTKTGYVLSVDFSVDPRPRSTSRKIVPGTMRIVPGTKGIVPGTIGTDSPSSPQVTERSSVSDERTPRPAASEAIVPGTMAIVPGTKGIVPGTIDLGLSERSQVSERTGVSAERPPPSAADEDFVPGTKEIVPGTIPSRARTRSARADKNKEFHRTKNKTPQTPLSLKLWESYRSFSPHAQEQMPSAWGTLVSDLLQEYGAEELELVIRWAFLSLDYEWHRHRNRTALGQILDARQLPARLEAARRWSAEGDSTIQLVERESMFSLLAPEDQVELKGWPDHQQQEWLELVRAGRTGADAMNRVQPPWLQ